MSLITGDGTAFVGERKILLKERIVTVNVGASEHEVGLIQVTPEGIAHVMPPIKPKDEYTATQVTLRLYLYPDGSMKCE